MWIVRVALKGGRPMLPSFHPTVLSLHVAAVTLNESPTSAGSEPG